MQIKDADVIPSSDSVASIDYMERITSVHDTLATVESMVGDLRSYLEPILLDSPTANEATAVPARPIPPTKLAASLDSLQEHAIELRRMMRALSDRVRL